MVMPNKGEIINTLAFQPRNKAPTPCFLIIPLAQSIMPVYLFCPFCKLVLMQSAGVSNPAAKLPARQEAKSKYPAFKSPETGRREGSSILLNCFCNLARCLSSSYDENTFF